MTGQRITEEQALFLASLPNVFCDLSYAIRIHASINRVAAIDEYTARDAIEFGLGAKVVENNVDGQMRLAADWRRERNAVEVSEGYFEVAVYELSRSILNISVTNCFAEPGAAADGGV